MRKLIVTAFLLIAAAAFTGVAAATVPDHFKATFSGHAVWCGFSGTDTVDVVDNFGSKSGGSSWDAGRLTETFVSDNGRAVSISYNAGHVENAPAITNPDGTTTYVTTFSGLDTKTQAVGGPVLEHGTGLIRVTFLFGADGNLISFAVDVLAGPNPNLTGAPDCSVIGPYLAG